MKTVVPLRGTGEANESGPAGCTALHPRLFDLRRSAAVVGRFAPPGPFVDTQKRECTHEAVALARIIHGRTKLAPLRLGEG